LPKAGFPNSLFNCQRTLPLWASALAGGRTYRRRTGVSTTFQKNFSKKSPAVLAGCRLTPEKAFYRNPQWPSTQKRAFPEKDFIAL
ncbi:hypothetical protein, partial [Desulfocurvus sp. DL9XJH121]